MIYAQDTYISENGMEKLFEKMDEDNDGKVGEKELQEYILKKDELKNKQQQQERDKKHTMDKEAREKTTEHIEKIFQILGKDD